MKAKDDVVVPTDGEAATVADSGSLETDRTLPSQPATTVRGDAENLDLEQSVSMVESERYQARDLLGTGGMGEVWLYGDERIGREVALKRLHDKSEGSDDARRRFLREARVQALIEHPAVVPVYDLGLDEEGRHYFTMRRIRGRTLEEILAGHDRGEKEENGRESLRPSRFSRRKLLTSYVGVCMAVHYAHTRGVVHRDLKPGNLMFGDFGEVYVLDWGIAKVSGETGKAAGIEQKRLEALRAVPVEDLTATGDLVGTLGYMAPEQMLGEGIDARADVYALGMILYEILSHKKLHAGRTGAEVVAATIDGVTEEPPLENVPPELDALWRRAMAVERNDRHASAQELADAVEAFLDGDRDLERRRALAEKHAEQAAAATEQIFDEETSAAEAARVRAEATQEVMKALTLDPGHGVARKTLARLLVEAPPVMPDEAEEAMAANNHRERVASLRHSMAGFISWLVCVPMVLLLGVRSWWPIAAAAVLMVVGLAYNYWIYKTERSGAAWTVTLGALAFGTVPFFATWLGPFVLVPPAAAVLTVIFAARSNRRERPYFLMLGVLACVIAFLPELLSLGAPAYSFREGGLMLFPRAVEIPPTTTVVLLMYTTVTFCAFPAYYLGRLRDSLSAAQRQLFFQAWQINRLHDGK